MNKALLSLLGCSVPIAAVLLTATVASPDAAKTMPFPEVRNLKRVPTFNYKGIIPQTTVTQKNSSQRDLAQPSRLDFRNKTPEEVAFDTFGCECPDCQNRAREIIELAVKVN